MITEGEAAILLEMTRRAFRNQSQSKQRSTLVHKNPAYNDIPRQTSENQLLGKPSYNLWIASKESATQTTFRLLFMRSVQHCKSGQR